LQPEIERWVADLRGTSQDVPQPAPKDSVTIEIDVNGRFAMDGQSIAKINLAVALGKARLELQQAGIRDPSVAIASDEAVHYKYVIEAISAAGSAGFLNIRFEAPRPIVAKQ
jgi:biopolymer transport protein ExbD